MAFKHGWMGRDTRGFGRTISNMAKEYSHIKMEAPTKGRGAMGSQKDKAHTSGQMAQDMKDSFMMASNMAMGRTKGVTIPIPDSSTVES